MTKKCDIIKKKLDSHLSHYADNNKELKRLADELVKQRDLIERQIKTNIEQERKIDEMYEIFVRSGWTLKTFIKVLTGLGVSAGSVLGIIKLYHLIFK